MSATGLYTSARFKWLMIIIFSEVWEDNKEEMKAKCCSRVGWILVRLPKNLVLN